MIVTYCAISFLAGGYVIPASAQFVGIWNAERFAPDKPTVFERFMTALIGAATWPMARNECMTPDEVAEVKSRHR